MTNKRVVIVLLAYAALVVGTVLVYESQQLIPKECAQKGWEATYIGWSNQAGACTYLQRVMNDLFVMVLLPLFFLLPIYTAIILRILYNYVKYKSVKSSIITLLISINFALLFWMQFIFVTTVVD